MGFLRRFWPSDSIELLTQDVAYTCGISEFFIMAKPGKFRILDHTADVGLEAYGLDLPEMFANAAKGMFEIMASPKGIRPEREFGVEIAADDPATLLHDWLDELLYLHSAKRLLLCRFELKRTETGLQARVFGESMDPARHELYTEIKAVTYHELAVKQLDDGWVGRVIFDI